MEQLANLVPVELLDKTNLEHEIEINNLLSKTVWPICLQLPHLTLATIFTAINAAILDWPNGRS